MNAFIDATCSKCGKRYGWFGKCVDQPACPKCGREPERAKLEEADREMEQAEQELIEEMARRKKAKEEDHG